MNDDRPTDAEKAGAVMRLLDEVDAAHAALSRARAIVLAGAKNARNSDLFPFIGDKVQQHLDAARSALWDVSRDVAPQFMSARRAIESTRGGTS